MLKGNTPILLRIAAEPEKNREAKVYERSISLLSDKKQAQVLFSNSSTVHFACSVEVPNLVFCSNFVREVHFSFI
jgi:hypothetical protein